jgi:hypothetical protein
MTGKECGDTERYYNCALRILIPILGDSEASINENLLAAVVLLRLYEEMTGELHVHVQLETRF